MRKPRLQGPLPRTPGGLPRHSAENFDEKFIAEGGPFHGLYGNSQHWAALTDDPEENKKLWTDLRKAIQDLANEARKSDVYQCLAFGAGNERITPNADAFSAARNEISADMNAVENGIRCAERAESACGAHPGRPERRRGTFSGRSRRQGRHGPHCQCAQACA